MPEAEPIVKALPASVASVPQARALACRLGRALMTGDQLHRLALVVTELVSNAIRHSASSDAVKLTMTPKDGYLCVQVTDSGRGLVPQPGAIGGEPGAGFGLFLVEQFTRRWGMTREGGRTRVWLEIDYVEDESHAPKRQANRAA